MRIRAHTLAGIITIFAYFPAYTQNAGINITETLPTDAFLEKYNYFSDGTIYIIPSSHQDIGWEDTPEACREFRDLKVISPTLKRLRRNPDYRFSMEYMLMLMEYLDRNPEKKQEIENYTRSGQLEWGGTYNQPYEGLYHGEALVRQVYLGRQWLRENFPGCDTRTAWNPDVPSKTMQMPQILKKAGIQYMNISRFEAGFYNWESPDGSRVHTFSSGQYYHADWPFNRLSQGVKEVIPLEEMIQNFKEVMLRSENLYKENMLEPAIGIISSKDLSEPLDIDARIEEWNRDVAPFRNFPDIRYGTFGEFMDHAISEKTRLPVLKGEWPNLWLYIHGPTHHKTVSEGRRASRLLTAAEKFSVFEGLLEGNMQQYPEDVLREAWSRAIYPDHGWGGNNGHVTDMVFHEKMAAAADTASAILDQSLSSIASRIGYKGSGIPLCVFNALSWERTDPVSCLIDLKGYANVVNQNTYEFTLRDHEGKQVPYQVIHDFEAGGSPMESLHLVFVAENIPPHGYRIYYLSQSEEPVSNNPVKLSTGLLENAYYRLRLAPGGLSSLYDKELGYEYLSTGKFLGGELFQMRSVGKGAGEFTKIQPPDMDGFEQLSQYLPGWTLLENGPVRTTVETSQVTRHASIRLRVMLYQTVKRIDFELDILGFDGTRYREFRMAFPLAMPAEGTRISYDVPMAVATVGESEISGAAGVSRVGLNYDGIVKDFHPREVQDWFGAFDGIHGITIASSVAVFDWIDPTVQPSENIILQPLLLASRRSCNGKGNWYYQAGSHQYRFSVFTHAGDWKANFRKGIAANQPLIAIATRRPVRGNLVNPATGNLPQANKLPEIHSFLKGATGNTIITAIKKSEWDEGIILRLNNLSGMPEKLILQPAFRASGWWKTNIIEEDPVPLKGPVLQISPFSIETIKTLLEYE